MRSNNRRLSRARSTPSPSFGSRATSCTASLSFPRFSPPFVVLLVVVLPRFLPFSSPICIHGFRTLFLFVFFVILLLLLLLPLSFPSMDFGLSACSSSSSFFSSSSLFLSLFHPSTHLDSNCSWSPALNPLLLFF